MQQLDVGAIQAWCRETNASEYQRYRTTLSAEELARCDRFHFARDRHDYANAHDLLRTRLSLYDARPPEAWRFRATSHGKPVLARDSCCAGPPLTFNLSHTRHIVACVVSRGAVVGIDIERADRLRDAMRIAARFFSPRELAALRACASDNDQARRFIELWTLKEALIKATGKGLSEALHSLAFDLDEEHAIRFTPPPQLAVATWQFSQYELPPDVVVAISVCGAQSSPPVMRVLGGDEALEIEPHRTTGWTVDTHTVP